MKKSIMWRAGALVALALLGLTLSSTVRVTAAEAAPEVKKPKWETSASLGLTLTSGNSESLGVVGNLVTVKKGEKNEIGAGISGGYGESRGVIEEDLPANPGEPTDPDSEKNTEFLKAFGQYNRLFSERLFGYARVDALYDDIAAVDYRLGISPGAGYYFIKQTNMTLAAEVGPGYVFEKVAGEKRDYASIRVAERFSWKFSETARLWQSLEFLPEISDFENFIMNFELGVAASLSKHLELQVVLSDTYDNQPAYYSWSVYPNLVYYEKNDLKISAGLNYKF